MSHSFLQFFKATIDNMALGTIFLPIKIPRTQYYRGLNMVCMLRILIVNLGFQKWFTTSTMASTSMFSESLPLHYCNCISHIYLNYILFLYFICIVSRIFQLCTFGTLILSEALSCRFICVI